MKLVRWFTLFLITILLLTGCKAGKKQETKIQKTDKAPEALIDVSKGLQDILKDTEKIEKVLDGTDMEDAKAKEQEKEKKEEKDAKENDKNQTKSKENNSNQTNNQDKGKEKFLEKDEKLLKTWEKIDKKIEEIHGKWNTYEVEAMKKGATTDRTDKFGESLNALTKAIEMRSTIDIYDFGSQSMLNLSAMFDLYRDEIKGDINKIKYITYQSYLKAAKGNPKEAFEILKDSEENINRIRLKLEKKDSKIDTLDKVNLAIVDMRKSLKENSIKLNRIKKNIIIKSLEELEK